VLTKDQNKQVVVALLLHERAEEAAQICHIPGPTAWPNRISTVEAGSNGIQFNQLAHSHSQLPAPLHRSFYPRAQLQQRLLCAGNRFALQAEIQQKSLIKHFSTAFLNPHCRFLPKTASSAAEACAFLGA